VGQVRRRRADGQERPELHRARLRRARGAGLLGSWTYGDLAAPPGEIDWDEIFGRLGARWFHTGGIFCALSESTPLVAEEAMKAAHAHGTLISYDLNYRDSLWKSIGGQAKAREVNGGSPLTST
jgi:sugar/nucleoside kinase (ribokinase family)